MTAAPYPVRLEGHLDAPLNRWLWLVKWVLVIPHFIVLAFLWMAFLVTSVVAFFSILFTGRYPRSIFDFNLGVMRWTWRVAFYSYSALGTDQYPPFTLEDVPGYPARVDIAYPERLSRGLVLVKWLLGLPHYLIVAIFAGAGTWALTEIDDRYWGGGLVSLLVIVAGVVLLFTGAYPRQIFDLVLGLNRWVVRVGAYAALMTDVYPPFRLDMGGDEPGALTVEPPARPESPVPPAAPARPHLGPGRVALLVTSGVTALVAFALLVAGGAVLWADQTQRDRDGYLMTPSELVSTSSYALISEPITIADLSGPDWVYANDFLGKLRLRADSSRPLFIGIARTSDAEAYLAGVEREQVDGLPDAHQRLIPGGKPGTAPGDARIWDASITGSGALKLNWDVREGNWSVVAMNPDGSRNIDTRLAVGARLKDLGWVAGGLLGAALVMVLVTGGLVAGALTGRR